jgi:hypothetical protein
MYKGFKEFKKILIESTTEELSDMANKLRQLTSGFKL